MKNIVKNNIILLKKYWSISKSYMILRLLTSYTVTIETVLDIVFTYFFINALFFEKNLRVVIILLVLEVVLKLSTFLIRSLYDKKYGLLFEKKVLQQVRLDIYNIYVKTDQTILENPDFHDNYIRSLEMFPQKVIQSVDTLRIIIGLIINLVVVLILISTVSPILIIICLFSAALQLAVIPKINTTKYTEYLDKTIDNRKKSYIYRTNYDLNNKINFKISPLKNLLFTSLHESNTNMINKVKKYSIKLISLDTLQVMISVLSLVVVFMYVGYSSMSTGMSPGGYVAVLSAAMQFTGLLGGFMMTLPKFAENSLYVNDYLNFTNCKSEIENTVGNKCSDFNSLDVENIKFGYSKNSKVLNDISLSIKKGQKVALVGFNGAGKTTLANILLRLYDPNSGEVVVNGERIKDFDIGNYRDLFAVIPQNNQLYSISIAEFILARKVQNQEDIENVKDALKQVGMYDYINNLKNNVDTLITKEFSEDGLELSGGQIQKLLIARALISNKEVIIIDEILSSIDPMEELKLFELILEVLWDKTIIFISHKLFTTHYADVIFVMDQGNIVEKGSHEELIKMNGTYNKMFTIQSEKYKSKK